MSINIGGVVYPAREIDRTTAYTAVAVGIIDEGPKGDPGPTGASGPAGSDGADGADGVDGSTGASGPSGATGSPGPVGATGPQGPAGPTGGDTSFYRWVQGTPEAVWDVTHPLNRPVSVDVVDSAGSIVEGDVTYLSPNHLTIAFSAPFAGEAYLT